MRSPSNMHLPHTSSGEWTGRAGRRTVAPGLPHDDAFRWSPIVQTRNARAEETSPGARVLTAAIPLGAGRVLEGLRLRRPRPPSDDLMDTAEDLPPDACAGDRHRQSARAVVLSGTTVGEPALGPRRDRDRATVRRLDAQDPGRCACAPAAPLLSTPSTWQSSGSSAMRGRRCSLSSTISINSPRSLARARL